MEELNNFVRENPLSSLITIKERLNLECSKWTIRRRLVEANSKHRRPAKKVDLTNLHRQRRLEFTEANLNRDWANVIFSDDSTDVGGIQSSPMETSQNAAECVAIEKEWPHYIKFMVVDVVSGSRGTDQN